MASDFSDRFQPSVDGGPVKSFLEHLEDLRWMLVKVFAALAVGMVVCFVGGNYIVKFLSYPLHLATQSQAAKIADAVPVFWGSNTIVRLPRAEFTTMVGATFTNATAVRVVPRQVGDELVLSLQPEMSAVKPPPEAVLLKNYSPISAFMVAIKLALYGGVVLSLPFIIYFIGQFVLPALKVKEREFVLGALGFGGVLFVLGMAFCYFLMLRLALVATVEFSGWLGFAADEWRAEDYITFVCTFMLVMGASFELPILLLALVKIGLVNYQTFVRHRAYWVVGELVVCAFLTPSGDPFTMFLMALPLHFLFEMSVLIAWYWDRRDRKRAAARAE